MKKSTFLALCAVVFAGSAVAETTVPAWDYPKVHMWWEWTTGGSSQFADYNNDGNMDLLMAHGNSTQLFDYDNGNYENKVIDGIDGLRYGGTQWLDYNNDGYLDFILVASTNPEDVAGSSSVSLYKNVDGTSFEKDEANSAILAAAKVYVPAQNAVQPGRVACGDFNNDGWIDVVVSGQPANDYDYWRLTKLFWNNQGTFAVDESGTIEQVNNNGAFVADFDNDGYMDFIAGGYSDIAGKQVVNVFYSNGDKTFTQQTLDHGCQDGNLLVMDADNDGNQDIFVSGYGTDNGIFMFKNNGERNFTYVSRDEMGLPDSGDGAWGWASCRAYMVAGDLNNDGYNDIITHCTWDGSVQYTYILLNNGDCTFTKDASHKNLSVRDGGVSIFDYNHDGRLDVHVYGYGENGDVNPSGFGGWYNNFMVNASDVIPYTAPTMGKAYYEQVDNDVILTWDAAIDGLTGEEGIRYNVYAKDLISGEVMMVAPANIETGYLKFSNHGSFLNTTTYTFKNMLVESYEFGVQAINNGNVASEFAVCVINPLSGVEEVEVAPVKVVAQAGTVRILNNGEAADYAVYAVNGMQVAGGKVAANEVVTLNADKGIYIVKVGAYAVKVVL